jgi:1-piperideine-2-carboxylate/1-pyrroline-2-carboxylate reductase [NAD(P)H]
VMKAIGRNILLDSADAGHEAGELIRNGVDARGLPTLFSGGAQALPAVDGTVLFKSCGNALWDLAAAQAAIGAAAPAA